ncbi:hypothetical protein VCRA2120E57_320029 [Vibrio crassostreae]|nr:hypothetical protein VCRA2117O377_250050 [Vibrio crassostreae]CAK3330538.1 hypothetical protein VCRA2123O393_240030 [Vibrio crassostreae]CAK3468488.1 hypothetical protein VCRA2123O13_240029 [Vibrio crassostreae]CAK3850730.1 hypothetical protein VCRA2120E57_320029 [Vibrio crassostreae]CDT20345.1 hypothetical protein VCR19J5_160061 [Vibrio crassostreae]
MADSTQFKGKKHHKLDERLTKDSNQDDFLLGFVFHGFG